MALCAIGVSSRMATQLTQGDIKQGEATKIVYNTREELTVDAEERLENGIRVRRRKEIMDTMRN